MKFFVFILLSLVCVSTVYGRAFDRVKRQDWKTTACARNPRLSFCGRVASGDSCEADSDRFINECLEGPCPRPDQSFCNNYAQRCNVPASEVQCGPGQPTGNDICTRYKGDYNARCTTQEVVPALFDFCTDYCRSCPNDRRAGDNCVYTQGEVPFCNNYQRDFSELCRGQQIGIEYLKFCNDYGIACRQPIGPTGQQEVPRGQTSCRQESANYAQRCQNDLIPAIYTDYCITASSGCGWPLGPPLPQVEDPSGLPQPPSLPGEQTIPQPDPREQLRQICKQNEARARVNCFQAIHVEPQHIEPCARYVRDCKDYYEDDEPLRRAASLFNSRVGIGDGWGITGIPYYPFNREGSIGVGSEKGVDFGTWGGGYSEKTGVTDFWEQGTEVGANWYSGRYGTSDQWGVPLLPFVSGQSGTDVNVPINERNLGQPISVNRGLGVSNFWGQNEGTVVDWLNGGVDSNNGWGVPLVGISGGRSQNVRFPSVTKFVPLLAGKRKRRSIKL